MRVLILIVLFLSFLISDTNKNNDIFLRLDTQGHTTRIGDIIVTKDKKIITSSNDKTIRIWNHDGKEDKKILGHIENGSGEIYAIALSPDEKYLAVGGYLCKPSNSQKGKIVEYIRIYNYKTGKIVKILNAHKGSVLDLSFGPDSNYLISGSTDCSAKIWNVKKGFSLLDTINIHTKKVNAVKIIKKLNKYYAVTTGFDNRVLIYDINNKKISYQDKKNYSLHSLAVSDKHIAISGFGSDMFGREEIQIYDYKLNKIKNIFVNTNPWGLNYSPNGKYLIAGSAANIIHINIFDVSKNYESINMFTHHKNLAMAVNFLDNNTAVSAGGNNNEIYVWDINTSRIQQEYKGVGDIVWSVGLNKNNIFWGNSDDCQAKNCSTLSKTFNLDTIKTVKNSQTIKYERIPIKKGYLSLSHERGGKYKYPDATLVLKDGNTVVTRITKKDKDGYQHLAYGFYKDYIISSGAGGEITVYNQKMKKIKSLIGHTGDVWSIALDGDRLVSGSSDQTIKIWNLSTLGNESKELYPILNIFISNIRSVAYSIKVVAVKTNSIAHQYALKEGDIIYGIDNKIFNSRKKYLNYVKVQKMYKYNILRDNKKMTLSIDKTKNSLGFNYQMIPQDQTIESQYLQFNNYIAWTNEGYFTASLNATQYLYFHVNQGAKKEAKEIPMEQLYDHFFRPDLVKIKLSGDETEYQKATKGMTYKEALSNPPPKVTFETINDQTLNKSAFEYDKVTTKKRHAKLTFSIKEHDKGGIGLIRIYQEGKLIQTIGNGKVNKSSANVYTTLEQEKQDKVQKKKQKEHTITVAQANIPSSSPKDFAKTVDINLSTTETISPMQTITTTNREGNYTIDLELISGNNEIAIEAFNKTNTVSSFRETMTIEANIPKKEPKLYAIVVGINNFQENNDKWKLKYSKNDAQDMKNIIETKMDRLYKDINVTLLTDEKVTKESIINSANSIAKQAKLEDTIVVYISTHGRASEGRLYLAPYNNGNSENWIDFEETFQAIQSIKALKQIFILDTCESGQANDIVSSVYDSRASVLARSSGVHMLLSTTKGTYAFESSDPKIQNGVFTYRVLQALQDKSVDKDNNGVISIVELSNKLKEQQNNPDYQQPIVRNVGGDVGLVKVK